MNSLSITMPEVCNDTIRNRWRGGYEKKTCDPERANQRINS